MASLPYVTAPGNVEKALLGIRSAQTPDRVTQDFVKTILKITGGSGNQIASFLKKIGFVNADGSPSDIYKRFRNSSTSGQACTEALKKGYAPLYKRNEYMHALGDEALRGLIIEETGQSENSNVPGLVAAAIAALKKFSTEAAQPPEARPLKEDKKQPIGLMPSPAHPAMPAGISLGYTINLNLPATSDIAVFNAIFKSLKENLLRDGDEKQN